MGHSAYLKSSFTVFMKKYLILIFLWVLFAWVMMFTLFPSFRDLVDGYDKRIVVKEISVSEKTKVEWYHYSLITSLGPEIIEFKKGNKRKLICKSEYVNDIYLRNDSLIIQFYNNDIEVLKDISYISDIKIGWDIGGLPKY